jgi:hypothetical protein
MTTATQVSQSITKAVARFYEAFPYPLYPLFAKPLWVDGYQSFSGFAAALSQQKAVSPSREKILLAGAGEIVSYVIRQWEPTSKSLYCVDLSKRSLLRSRFRLLSSSRQTFFVRRDLDAFLESTPLKFGHVDAYGMLHHMTTPSLTLKRLFQKMQPGATMRLMVYNAPARTWLNELQRVFRLLNVDPYSHSDRLAARKLLSTCCKISPALAFRMKQIGVQTLTNDARFADTFLHPNELRLAPTTWFTLLADAGFKVVGVFDRYAELDDLKNPLWQAPTPEELQERADDGRYENNLELYVQKPGFTLSGAASAPRNSSWNNFLRYKTPPRSWFTFRETKGLSRTQRQSIWRSYLAHVVDGRRETLDHLLEKTVSETHIKAFQRLARIGALLPGQFMLEKNCALLKAPMSSEMTKPEIPLAVSLTKVQGGVDSPIKKEVKQWLTAQNRFSERRLNAILLRLERAQK